MFRGVATDFFTPPSVDEILTSSGATVKNASASARARFGPFLTAIPASIRSLRVAFRFGRRRNGYVVPTGRCASQRCKLSRRSRRGSVATGGGGVFTTLRRNVAPSIARRRLDLRRLLARRRYAENREKERRENGRLDS